MTPVMLALVAILIMLCLIIVLRIPVGFSMALVGFSGYVLMESWPPALSIVKSEVSTALLDLDLATIPLFLLMGSFANVAGVSDDVYKLSNRLLGHMRGGIAMATVVGCAMFGAVCGSSLATAGTFGKIAYPQMKKRNYGRRLAVGCIAGGGSLGSLVPPSVMLIIYAITAEQYIIELFVAAILPAITALIAFLITIQVYVRIFPQSAPAGEKTSFMEKIHGLREAWRAIVLILLMVGGIYGGVFTVQEAASLGAILAIIFAVLSGKMTWQSFWDALFDTACVSAMIYTMIIGASIFNYFIVVSEMPNAITGYVMSANLATWAVFLFLTVFYLIMGSIFDSVSAMIITLPFVLPIVEGLGYSPVWWGIVNLILMEVGMITPPIGINVFILKGMMGDDVSLGAIFSGVVPFVIAALCNLLLLYLFPEISLFLLRFLG